MILRDVKVRHQITLTFTFAILCATVAIGRSLAAQTDDQQAGEIKDRIV